MASNLNDYQQVLLETILPKRKYKLAEVRERLVKVAFDVVRFKDDDNLNLWKIESGQDGEYIVALYEDTTPEQVKTAKLNNKWSSIQSNDSIIVSYANVPVAKFSAQELNMDVSELNFATSFLPKKLAENATLRQSLLKKISPDFRQNLTSQFPELNND